MQLKKEVVAGMTPSPVVISSPLFPTNRRAVWAVGPGNLKPWTKLLTAQNGPQSQATYRRFHPQQSEDAAHNTSHTMQLSPTFLAWLDQAAFHGGSSLGPGMK